MSAVQQVMLALGSGGSSGWAYKSIGTAATGASPTVGLPASHSAGDLLVLVVCGDGTSVTSPAGWTVSLNQGGTKPNLCVFYKIDSGSETSVAISGGAPGTQGIMLSYSGINAAPLDVNGTVAVYTTQTTLTTNSLTTTAANDLVISVFGVGSGAPTFSTPVTGCTTRYNGGGIASTTGILIVDELMAAAGATTARSTTRTGGTSNSAAMACSFKI